MPQFTGRDGGQWEYDDLYHSDEGGMGTVFPGKSLVDGRAAAVKQVRLRWATTRAERIREREIEVGDRLTEATRSGDTTEHLVLPLDIAFFGSDLLIVMPRADGSLADVLEEGALTLEDGLAVVRQVAEGLVELAALSIVHRDLKPANVLRFGDTWKISDFGLSRILTEATGTHTTAGGGSPPYMAPEVWTGRRGTAKSDLYALGILAYEVFTGARPFTGPWEDDFERQHLTSAPPSTPELPPRLARLLARLVEKAPADRPHDARQVVEAVVNLQRKLTPQQDALVEAALHNEERRREERMAADNTAADLERVKQERRQAVADLTAILEDAFDDVAEALPDARLDARAGEVTLGGLRVRFETYEPIVLSGAGGSAVLNAMAFTAAAGEEPRPGPTGNRSAHAMLICRRTPDGRLRWTAQILALRPDGAAALSLPGPERSLDADAVIDILRAALDAEADA
ncbi:serine/threonine-protein kinase [Actinoplanes sp. NPDC049596]|uniref:serine/threonine-protein kinase n=1 Tax=unclassified Actinoplanes TaxID=2626549 RepID=UPI00342D1AC5